MIIVDITGWYLAGLVSSEYAVNVEFARGPQQTFDLVIGADGLHSITRQLAFGEEHQFLHFLGGYLAVFTVPGVASAAVPATCPELAGTFL